jgi:hypothetical protein
VAEAMVKQPGQQPSLSQAHCQMLLAAGHDIVGHAVEHHPSLWQQAGSLWRLGRYADQRRRADPGDCHDEANAQQEATECDYRGHAQRIIGFVHEKAGASSAPAFEPL